jgi:hypothetical protein
MSRHIKGLLSISLFALGAFVSNAAQAQSSCTPTLYLFRHAEDVDTKKPPLFQSPGLTAIGKTHAKFYPSLINQLETTLGAQSPCVLGRVFAMWDRNTGAKPLGTTNPYQTALPLAQHVGQTQIPPVSYVPEMFFTDAADNHKYYLCEYPNDSPCENDAGIKKDGTSNHRNAYFKYNGDTYSHLYSYLSAYFQTYPNTSVAIFHTSQGMPSVSWAFGVAPVIVICPTDGQLKCTLSMVAPFKNSQLGDCPLPIDASTSSKPCYKQEYRNA